MRLFAFMRVIHVVPKGGGINGPVSLSLSWQLRPDQMDAQSAYAYTNTAFHRTRLHHAAVRGVVQFCSHSDAGFAAPAYATEY